MTVWEVTGAVVMDTGSESGDKPSSNYRLVEEEFTITVPLVRPKPAFLALLQAAGAPNEVFTLKEILRYMKLYIVERQLFDETNPRIVRCYGDLLGEVFEVEQFTIDEAIGLITNSCTQLPDTCMKRRRRLVSKPQNLSVGLSSSQSSSSVTSTPPTSLTISVCPSSYPTVSTVTPSSSVNKLSSKPCTKSRKSSSSSLEKSDSSLPHVDKNSSVSKETNVKEDNVTSGAACNVEESSSSEGSTHKKRKNKGKNSERKRHKTEPAPTCSRDTSHRQGVPSGSGESSRRRGTSLSITYGDDNTGGDYPWYFQVELDDGPTDDDDNDDDKSDDDKSEVLSVQGKETVIVQDSTDDLWFLEEESISVEVPSDTDFSVEYDVESDVSPATESDLSSVRSGEGLLVICKESDVEFFADCSDSDTDDGDKELSAADNWSCTECNLVNPPVQRYCSRCWKLRSDWLPSSTVSGATLCSEKVVDDTTQDRDIIDDSKLKEKLLTFDSGLSSLSSTLPSSQETVVSDISLSKLDSVFNDTPSANSQLTEKSERLSDLPPLMQEIHDNSSRCTYSNIQLSQQSVPTIGSVHSAFSPVKNSNKPADLSTVNNGSSTNSDDRCMICLTGAKTASLIHGYSGHQVCCFPCATRLKRLGKLCPVCRRPIQKVVRNYIL